MGSSLMAPAFPLGLKPLTIFRKGSRGGTRQLEARNVTRVANVILPRPSLRRWIPSMPSVSEEV